MTSAGENISNVKAYQQSKKEAKIYRRKAIEANMK